MWDLCLALWGRLRGLTPEDEDDGGESRPQRGPDSHEVTMLRREAVSEWLKEVVAHSVREDVRWAKATGGSGSNVDQILAHLSGNDVGEACSVAHRTGNHYAALVAASAAGGGAASVHGELVLQQLEGYQQMRADRCEKLFCI